MFFMLLTAVSQFVTHHTGLTVQSVGEPVSDTVPVIVRGFGKTRTLKVAVEYEDPKSFTLVGFGQRRKYTRPEDANPTEVVRNPFDNFT